MLNPFCSVVGKGARKSNIYRIIADKESTYFEKAKTRFSKNWKRFYAKITLPTCFPHKITPNSVIFEKI
jgi:hypothetical protein